MSFVSPHLFVANGTEAGPFLAKQDRRVPPEASDQTLNPHFRSGVDKREEGGGARRAGEEKSHRRSRETPPLRSRAASRRLWERVRILSGGSPSVRLSGCPSTSSRRARSPEEEAWTSARNISCITLQKVIKTAITIVVAPETARARRVMRSNFSDDGEPTRVSSVPVATGKKGAFWEIYGIWLSSNENSEILFQRARPRVYLHSRAWIIGVVSIGTKESRKTGSGFKKKNALVPPACWSRRPHEPIAE